MTTRPVGRIAAALRERLEMAGCYALRDAVDMAEIWFSPHLNREFTVPRRVATAEEANAVLRSAGMEPAFPTSRSGR